MRREGEEEEGGGGEGKEEEKEGEEGGSRTGGKGVCKVWTILTDNCYTCTLLPPCFMPPPPFTLRPPPRSSFPPSSSSPGKWKDYPVGITGYSYLFGSLYMGLACLYFVMVGRSQEFILPSKVSLVTLVYQARLSPSYHF